MSFTERAWKQLAESASGVLFTLAVGSLIFTFAALSRLLSMLSPKSWMWDEVVWAWLGAGSCIVCAWLAGKTGGRSI